MWQNLPSAAVVIGALRVKLEQQAVNGSPFQIPTFLPLTFILRVKVTQNVA